MAFRVNDFIANLERDGARPNLFEVQMSFPAEARPQGAEVKFTLMGRSSQLPGSSTGFATLNYFGREVKVSGNKIFSEWTVTLYNDNDFKVRNAFERWMNGVNSNFGNLRTPTFASTSSYMRDALVTQMDQTGNRVKTYSMVGAFPTDISPIDLDWGSNDAVEEFTVTFQYQYWLSDTTDVQPAGLSSLGIL